MVSSSGISFSGLGSGLDTQAIVRQLVSIERLPIQALQTRRGTEQKRLDLVNRLGDLVKALQRKADDLATPEEFFAFKANVSDERALTVTTDSNAEAGIHTVDIQRLAATDRWAFDAVSSRDSNLTEVTGEQINFKVGTTEYTLTVDAAKSSLDDIASQIEDMAGGAVSATVVNTGTTSSPSFQLVLASKMTGEEGRLTDIFSSVGQVPLLGPGTPLTIAYTPPDGSGNATSNNNVTVGNDALAEINGLLIRRSTNEFTDVIAGISFELRSLPTDGPVTVAVEPDRTAVRERIDSFITAYNDVVDFINKQSTFTPGEGDEGGRTGGLLFGDSLLGSVRRSLRSALFDVDLATVTGDTTGYSTLSIVGIRQDRDGMLSVDSATFDEKFAENLPALMDLFADTDGFDNGGAAPNTPGYFQDTTADSGLMNRLSRSIDQMFGRLGTVGNGFQVSGIFDVRQEAIRASMARYDQQIERRESRLETYEETLSLRFARLEQLMGSLNAQGAALQSAFG